MALGGLQEMERIKANMLKIAFQLETGQEEEKSHHRKAKSLAVSTS